MSKGFLWFCQNNDATDYVRCSVKLAESIKKHNSENKICVVTDQKSQFESEYVDIVKVMKHDDSVDHDIKWANEYKAFDVTPFTHTIKLESDMLWTQNTDWWWSLLWQHDIVFSVDCKDYKDNTVKDKRYRKISLRNNLPNIYNGLSYFRKSLRAKEFFNLCKIITQNWEKVSKEMLIGCHDKYPSTDVVYGLAYRIMDPTQKELIDYPWFKFIHNKPAIHRLEHVEDHNQYLFPVNVKDKIILGSQRLSRVWHYVDKDLNVRTF